MSVCDGCQQRPCVCETVVLPTAEKDVPCLEAMRLLDALWDLYWNGPGSCDYGDHAGYTWAEDRALTDAAERVEDHYVAHGCRVIPPETGRRDG